jgi:hypothetical protein
VWLGEREDGRARRWCGIVVVCVGGQVGNGCGGGGWWWGVGMHGWCGGLHAFPFLQRTAGAFARE